MSALTGLELARMRRTADAHLPVTGEVWRRALASDSKGGRTETFSRVSAGPWRIAPVTTVNSTITTYAERLGGAQGWWATAQYHVDVRLYDQLRVGTKTFEVIGLDTDRSWHISKRALCKELT